MRASMKVRAWISEKRRWRWWPEESADGGIGEVGVGRRRFGVRLAEMLGFIVSSRSGPP